MKKHLNQKNLLIAALIIGLLFFGITTYLSNKSVKALKQEVKSIEQQNTKLINLNKLIKNRIEEDSITLIQNKNKINNLLKSDSINAKQLTNIKWKYEKIKRDYNNATDVQRDSIFTDIINN
jgi:predicted PurR-regulated permease PerM